MARTSDPSGRRGAPVANEPPLDHHDDTGVDR
jgi:hypothetical protein